MSSLSSRSFGLVLAIAALLAIASTVSLAAPSFAAEPTGGDLAVANELAVEQALFDDTNADRAANGLPALDFDTQTLSIARQRAATQLDADNLSHYAPDGSLAFVDLLNAAHLGFALAGENLARSSSSNPDVITRIEQALMQSPTHRKNILEPTFARLAIGAATDPSGRIAFAEIFRSAD